MTDPCKRCTCWDPDREGCTMPQADRWYACQIESQRPENQQALQEYVEWVVKNEDKV